MRRVKRLEDDGFIAGYTARLNPAQLGLTLTAYINVRLGKQPDRDARAPAEAFSASVQTWPEVVDCVALSGEMDYLMRVVVLDMAHYSRFVMDTLLRHPSVLDCKSSFVLNQVKATSALPI